MTKAEIILIILGIILLIYGGMVAAVGSGTRFYMVWLFLGALCLIAAAFVHTGLFAKMPAFLKWGLAGFAIICVIILLAGTILIFTRFHETGRPGLDAIIVLGAQVREDGPSSVLKYRLDAAADYLKKNPETLCVVSGGQGYNEPFPEAEGMRRYLEAAGIAPERIIMEDRSENTAENMAFSKAILEKRLAAQSGIGIVTNNFHMYRALRTAGKTGLTNVCGISAGSAPLYLPNNILRECLAIVKSWVLG